MITNSIHEFEEDSQDDSLVAALIAGFLTGVIASIGVAKLFMTKG